MTDAQLGKVIQATQSNFVLNIDKDAIYKFHINKQIKMECTRRNNSIPSLKVMLEITTRYRNWRCVGRTASPQAGNRWQVAVSRKYQHHADPEHSPHDGLGASRPSCD